jgi:putative ABC transport system permease protein
MFRFMIDAQEQNGRQPSSPSPTFAAPALRSPRALSNLSENIVSAMHALAENWVRSLLTITGIVVGVVAIVTLVAILQGVKSEIRRQVEGLGANLVLIVPSRLDENGQMNPAAMIGISSLTEDDVQTLTRVPGVERVAPVYIVAGTVELAHKEADAFVVATNRVGVEMNPTRLAAGRYYDDNEGNVCILGYKPAHELFGDGPAVGKTVQVKNLAWKVVGVLGKPKGDGTLGSQMLALNTLVYLPANTVKREIPGGQISRIVLQTDYKHPADKLDSTLNTAVKRSHGGRQDFGVITQQKGLALVIKLLNLAQSLLVLIATISLFVAGIGIMNIMLVTVTERTREIGIRKTVGARRTDIFLQFLTEAVVLSLLGGVIGIGASWAICAAIAHFSELTPQITPPVVVMALLVCSCVGIVFGVTPAVRASRLDPIVALRHE